MRNNLILNPDQIKHLREDAIRGIDIGDLVYRLCVMNVLLHGIGTPTAPPPILRDDALAAHPGHNYSIVLANPPFGKKSSVKFVDDEGGLENEDLTVYRDDFWTMTTNKHLYCVQHIKTILAINGPAALSLGNSDRHWRASQSTVRRTARS